MAMSDQASSAHADLRAGPLNENVRQGGRDTTPPTTTYSPHQQLTGGGIPSGRDFVDPTTIGGPSPGHAPPGPAVEHFPIGESDAHAGTYTLGRKDA